MNKPLKHKKTFKTVNSIKKQLEHIFKPLKQLAAIKTTIKYKTETINKPLKHS